MSVTVASKSTYVAQNPSVTLAGGATANKVVAILFAGNGDGNTITAATLNGVSATDLQTVSISTGGMESVVAVAIWTHPGNGTYTLAVTSGAGVDRHMAHVYELVNADTLGTISGSALGGAATPRTVTRNITGETNKFALVFAQVTSAGITGPNSVTNTEANLVDLTDTNTTLSQCVSGTDLVVAADPTTYSFVFSATSVSGGNYTKATSATIVVNEVAVDTTNPTVLSATINVDGDRTTVVHDEAVTGDGTGWQFDDATPLTYVSGVGTDTLVFSHRVILASETRTLEYDDTTGDMEDLADTPNPLESFTGQAVTNNSEAVADETDPELDTQVLTSATTLVLGFDEPVTFTDQTGMSVSASGGAVTITGIAGGETNTVTLTLSRSLASTESLSFSYDSGTGDVEDLAGNALATISNRLVTNNVNNTPGSVSLIGPGLIQ